jgi:hypothetical protein
MCNLNSFSRHILKMSCLLRIRHDNKLSEAKHCLKNAVIFFSGTFVVLPTTGFKHVIIFQILNRIRQ